MPFIPHTPEDTAAMLKRVGVRGIDDLFADIPASMRPKRFELPKGLSEHEACAAMEDMARHTVARLLDLLDLPQTLSPQWEGLHAAAPHLEPAPVPPPIPASLRCTPTA